MCGVSGHYSVWRICYIKSVLIIHCSNYFFRVFTNNWDCIQGHRSSFKNFISSFLPLTIFFSLCVVIYVPQHACMYVCHCMCGSQKTNCRLQRLNSGTETWRQMPLPSSSLFSLNS